MMCFNRKVLAVLGAVALGVWLFAPRLLGPVLPLLAVAICPLSMLLMMKAMSGGARSCQTSAPTAQAEAGDTEAQIIRLQAEIDRLRAQQGAQPPSQPAPPPTGRP
jgi:hypothetical protein